MQLRRFKLRTPAFTLIELLIVVAIIAILAAIAVPNFLEAQTRSKVSRAKADLRTIFGAMEAYRVDNQKIPSSGASGGVIEFLRWTDLTNVARGEGRRLTTPIAYMSSIPWDYFNTQAFKAERPHNVTFQVINASFFYRGRAYQGSFHNGALGFPRTEADGLLTAQIGLAALTPCDYIISTCGPDLVPWPQNSSSNIYIHMEYDPTNGTVSKGDIWITDTMGMRGGGGR